MLGAFLFGFINHYVLDSPDNVAQIPATEWGNAFTLSAHATRRDRARRRGRGVRAAARVGALLRGARRGTACVQRASRERRRAATPRLEPQRIARARFARLASNDSRFTESALRSSGSRKRRRTDAGMVLRELGRVEPARVGAREAGERAGVADLAGNLAAAVDERRDDLGAVGGVELARASRCARPRRRGTARSAAAGPALRRSARGWRSG